MSTQPSSQRSERSTTVLVTVILGMVLGIFQSIVWLITEPLKPGITSNPSFAAFLLLVSPLIWAIAFLIQGVWVGYHIGQIKDGTLTGIFTGLFGGIIAAVGHVLIITLSLHSSDQDPITTAFATFSVVTFTLILTIGGGSVFGALGGLVGQYFSPVPPQIGGPFAPPPFFPPNPPYTPQQPVSPQNAPQPTKPLDVSHTPHDVS
jgi:hypothetical protein